MSISKARVLLGAIAQRLVVALAGVIVLFGFSPAIASASALPQNLNVSSNSLVAVTSASRYEKANESDRITSDAEFEAMKQRRREWQSQASEQAAAAAAAEENASSSLGETVKEKLNLDEIVEGSEADNNRL